MNAPSVEQPNENGQVPSVGTGDLLCSLDDPQLDHVALGMAHSFGAILEKRDGSLFFTLETGQVIGVHGASITVGDLWKTAEALTA